MPDKIKCETVWIGNKCEVYANDIKIQGDSAYKRMQELAAGVAEHLAQRTLGRVKK